LDRAGLGAGRPVSFSIKGTLFTMITASTAKLFTTGADDGEGFDTAFLRR
jgi:hypothetical protein